jgi:RNA polymerase sigma factor (sigma-70 family)
MTEDNLNDRLADMFGEHSQRLFTCALAVTGSCEQAEDAVQEAFYRLFRLRKEPRHLKAYVFRSVRNAALDQRKRNSSFDLELSPAIFDSSDEPSDRAVASELTLKVDQAMAQLSADERETIVSHLYGDLTFREIAEMRGASNNTVSSWYRRGIEKLRRQIGGL